MPLLVAGGLLGADNGSPFGTETAVSGTGAGAADAVVAGALADSGTRHDVLGTITSAGPFTDPDTKSGHRPAYGSARVHPQGASVGKRQQQDEPLIEAETASEGTESALRAMTAPLQVSVLALVSSSVPLLSAAVRPR
jgi:hypothetical protein